MSKKAKYKYFFAANFLNKSMKNRLLQGGANAPLKGEPGGGTVPMPTVR
jgi:hypothetical protein